MPLQQANTPELRHVRINLFARGVNWVLTFFEDLQRHQQLEYFSVSGRARFTHHNHFPRVAWLRQWLTLNKSPVFRFRMKLDADYVPGAESVREEVFEDYRRATGEKNVTHFREINVRYPEMSFSYPTMMKEASESSSDESMDEDDDDDDDDNEGYSSKLNQWCRGEPLDKNMEEVRSRTRRWTKNMVVICLVCHDRRRLRPQWIISRNPTNFLLASIETNRS